MATQHMTLLEDLKRAAWSRTSPVGGHTNAWEFRKDRLGNMVRWADYGNRKSPFGWELDFIEPKSVGGSTDSDQPAGPALARQRRPQQQHSRRASWRRLEACSPLSHGRGTQKFSPLPWERGRG